MKSKHLPLTHALAWIVGSTFLISGPAHLGIKRYLENRAEKARDPAYAILSIVQTGPQKEALTTEYLAEVLDLSIDRPYSSLTYNVEKAKRRLLRSPLIAQAEVKVIHPDTLYIDYTVRQPIAWVEDFADIAIDKEGYLFPFSPFFSPKNLPSIYLGLGPFGTEAKWGAPLQGKYIDLAFDLLKLLPTVRRIDVSNAFAESCGKREIVLIDTPSYLRLSTKNYAQALGNYLKLREQMQASAPLKEKVFDFRIDQLAFIQENP